jgi:hypothetical protein
MSGSARTGANVGMVLTLLGACSFVLAAVLWLLAGASPAATDVFQFTVVPLFGIPGAVLLLVGAAKWPTRTALVLVVASVAILVVVPVGIVLFVVAAVVWQIDRRRPTTVLSPGSQAPPHHQCARCGKPLSPVWVGKCQHCGAQYAEYPPEART